MTEQIIEIIRDVSGDEAMDVSDDSSLVGEQGVLDSMGLVQVCLRLEELADEQGFSFDWTSEAAMSRSRSIFRSVRSLADEFTRQKDVPC